MTDEDKFAAAHLLRDAYRMRLHRGGVTSRLSHWTLEDGTHEELLIPLDRASPKAVTNEIDGVEDFLAVLELLGLKVVDERCD